MSQPPMMPQQPYQADATLKFTVQGNVLTSNLVAPTLTIDGHPAPASGGGGSTHIPIMSGPLAGLLVAIVVIPVLIIAIALLTS